MRPAVHPDGALDAPGVASNANRGDLLRGGIFFGPDAHRKTGAAEQIVGAVRNALAFGNGLRGRFPTVGLQARGVVDGQSKIIAEFRAGETLEQKYMRQTRSATVFIAVVVGIFTALALIGVIWTATNVARLDSQLTGIPSVNTNNCLSQGGTNPDC